MTIGERIRQARNEKGLTQKQLGSISGTSEITIRQYELGKRQPRIEQLKSIASALDVDVNWLMNGYTLEQRDQAWKDYVARRFEEALRQEAKDDENFINAIKPHLAPLDPLTDEESALKILLNSMGYDIMKTGGNYFFTYENGGSEISKDDLNELLSCAQNGLKIAAKTLELKLMQEAFGPRTPEEMVFPPPAESPQTPPEPPPAPPEGKDTPAAQDAPEGAGNGE